MSVEVVRIARSNFEAGLLELRQSVSTAEFVTLHADFSQPLPSTPTPSASSNDQKVTCLEKSLEKTSVVRIELCTVSRIGQKTVFEAYVDPRPCAGWDVNVVFRASSLESIPSYEDLSTDGVPHIGQEQAVYIRRRVLDNPEDPLAAILGPESLTCSTYVSTCGKISDWALAPFRPPHVIDRSSADEDELTSDVKTVDLRMFGAPEAVAHAIVAQFHDYCMVESMLGKEVLRLRRREVTPGARLKPPARSNILARMAGIDGVAIDSLACLNRILDVIIDKTGPVFLLNGEATLVVLHRMSGFKPVSISKMKEDTVAVTNWMPLAVDLDVALKKIDLGTFVEVERLRKKCSSGPNGDLAFEVVQGAGEPAPSSVDMDPSGSKRASERVADVVELVVGVGQPGRRLEDLLIAGRCFGDT